MKIRFTNEHAVMDARSGRQHLVVQGTKAFYAAIYENGKILENNARYRRNYTTLACCSNWKFDVDKFHARS